MTNANAVREHVSALADGRLRDGEFVQAIASMNVNEELRATWRVYHLVGDVLRSGVHAPCTDSSIFLTRFQSRLAGEPPFQSLAMTPEAKPVARPGTEAANEPVFRWKLVAGAASLAAAVAIGWNWIGAAGTGAVGGVAELAQRQVAAPAAAVATVIPAPAAQVLTPSRVLIGSGEPQVMLRDPRLDQFLEAHQQVGGASGLPSRFLRNATFERPSSR